METKKFKYVYDKPEALVDKTTHYCPGCGHGIVHKLLSEVIDELGVREKAIVVAPVGCSVLIYDYMNFDGCEASHGRAPAVATGLKRVNPDSVVISYQGDGDLLAIGTGEAIHAANRGENFTTIFINNAIYGMTGGQMAPTTLKGQVTTTSPHGRNPANAGMPLKMSEIVSNFDGVAYVERVSCNTANNARKTKKALQKAMKISEQKIGTSFIEVVSNCPSGWKCTPVQSLDWIKDEQIPYFPLGVLKEPGK